MTAAGWMNYVIPDPEAICVAAEAQEAGVG